MFCFQIIFHARLSDFYTTIFWLVYMKHSVSGKGLRKNPLREAVKKTEGKRHHTQSPHPNLTHPIIFPKEHRSRAGHDWYPKVLKPVADNTCSMMYHIAMPSLKDIPILILT